MSRIKDLRSKKASKMRYTLSEGSSVSWNGKYGFSTGVVKKVKRKNAEVLDDCTGTLWNIPMNMLEVIND